MTPDEIDAHLDASGPGRTLDDLTPEEQAKAAANWAAMAKNVLAERVYSTALAFKEAEEDPGAGRHLRTVRWADYMAALRAHAYHFVIEFQAAQAKENGQ